MNGSVMVHFAFSTGLAKSITVPAGLLAHCQEHVRHVEQTLGLELQEPYRDNPRRWKPRKEDRCPSDEVLCIVAQDHNVWVRWLYEMLGEWSKPGWHEKPLTYSRMQLYGGSRPLVEEFEWGTRVTRYDRFGHDVPVNADGTPQTEVLTPDQAAMFWHGLQKVDVPVGRWTREYYRDRMEHLYEVLRGREHEGASIGCDPLTSEQAAAVVWLLDVEEVIPGYQLDLEVPKGYDELRSSYDGGYERCSICGAVDPDDLCEHLEWCDECEEFVGPGAGPDSDDDWCEHVKDRPVRQAAEIVERHLQTYGNPCKAAVYLAVKADCLAGADPSAMVDDWYLLIPWKAESADPQAQVRWPA